MCYHVYIIYNKTKSNNYMNFVLKWRCNAKVVIRYVCWYCIQLMMYVLAILTHMHMCGKMRNIIIAVTAGVIPIISTTPIHLLVWFVDFVPQSP